LLDDKTQKGGKPAALVEMRIAQEPFHLLLDCLSLLIRKRWGGRG
jgi:hypothetical protein